MKKTKKLVHGVGVNDADYNVSRYEVIDGKYRRVWECPYYARWKSMLGRCFDQKQQERQKSMIGNSVCDDWLVFSNFRAWMVDKKWEGMCLDKDLLVEGNKEYSASTCVFIPNVMNTFFCHLSCSGSSSVTRGGKFLCLCHNPITKKREYVGVFDDAEHAKSEWAKRKYEIGCEIIEIYKEKLPKEVCDRFLEKLGDILDGL